MSKIVTTEISERRHRVLIDRHELETLVVGAVLQHLGIQAGDGVAISFKTQGETEGSPGYKVGVGCIVEVTQDLRTPEDRERLDAREAEQFRNPVRVTLGSRA